MADTLIRRVSSRRLLSWLVIAVLVVAAVLVWRHERAGGASYRTATAATGSVTQSLSSVGTVASATSAVAAFPVAGTVATVPVRLGQKVTTGQRLATLQTDSLQQQVDSAKNTLASARQTMADASTAQSDVSTDATSTGTDLGADSESDTLLRSPSPSASPSPSGTTTRGGGGKGGGSGSGGSGGSGSGGSSATVTRLQRQVRAEQQQIDAELTALHAALRTQQADCKAGSGSGATTSTSLSVDVAPVAGEVKGSVATPVGTTITLLDGSSTVETVTTTASPYPYDFTGLTGAAYTLQLTVPVSTITTACQQSLQSVLQQEQQVADDERSQQGYEAQLDTAIQQLESQRGGSGGQSPSGSTHPSGGSSAHSGTGASGYPGSSGSGSTATGQGTGGSSTTSSAPSAAQLAADQAHIDADSASLTVARQNLSAATLTSPIAGTVADIGLSAGQSVDAGSSTEAITVLGGGTPQVQTTVALADLDQVKVGDPVAVDVDGVGTPQTGHVARIGVLDTTTGSTTTYPVTIALAPTSARLLDGTDASVTITVRTAHDVLTVPTSAVRSLGSFHTVEVLAGSKLTATPVQVGAVGPLLTQITAGLKAGQSVVLADLSEPLPSSSSTTTRFGGGFGGGLGAGGGQFTQRVSVGGG